MHFENGSTSTLKTLLIMLDKLIAIVTHLVS